MKIIQNNMKLFLSIFYIHYLDFFLMSISLQKIHVSEKKLFNKSNIFIFNWN